MRSLLQKNEYRKEKGNRKHVIFLGESFKYLTTGSSGIKCVHFTLAWTETQSRQTVLQRGEGGGETQQLPQKAVLPITALWSQSQGKTNSFYHEYPQTVNLVSHYDILTQNIKLSPAPCWEEVGCFYCYKTSGTPRVTSVQKEYRQIKEKERKELTTLPSEMG